MAPPVTQVRLGEGTAAPCCVPSELTLVLVLWRQKDYRSLAALGFNYAWMFALLPWNVVLGSILFGGFLVGVVVTATHQSEEFISQ